jgi:hypothetical protein
MSRVRVFISHSARDGEAQTVRLAVRDALTSEANQGRYAVLMDDFTQEPGDAWRTRINLWLGSCDAAVVVVSKRALQSTYVAFELSVLGYRRWHAQREGSDFRIIPVLVDVTMPEVEESLLGPTQLSEWMSTAGSDPTGIANQIVNVLAQVVPATARPIENTARVLDAHLPETDFYLAQSAAALGVELPWDTAESKRFCLALRLLGCGMSLDTVKALRQLRDDPTFQAKHLETIVDLLSSAWVGLKADEIRELVSSDDPPALVLNAAFPDTARMYMSAARYRFEKVLKYQWAEPNTVIEELQDDAEYRQRIVDEVRKELYRTFEASTEAELQMALDDYAEMEEVVVVTISARSIHPATVAVLRETFRHVTFFLLTGAKGEHLPETGQIHVIRPQLAPSDEETCRKQYDDFCRRIHRR